MAWGLGFAELLCWGILVYSFSVFLPSMQRDLGWPQEVITAAYSLSILVRGVASVAVGWWIDRYGVRLLMTAGGICGVATVLAWSSIHSYAGLYLVFIALGLVTSAVLYEPAFAAIVSWFTQRRNQALLVVTVLGGFASTVFLPLSAVLVSAAGWRRTLVIFAAVLVVGAVLPFALLVRDRRRVPTSSDDDDRDPGGAGAMLQSARDAVASVPFRWLTAASFLSYLTLVLVNVHLISYLLQRGLAAGVAATAAGALGLLSVLGRITLMRVAQRIRLARVTAMLVSCQALAVVPLLLPLPAGLVAFVLLFGAGFGVLTIARASLLADYAPPTMYARWAGLQALVVTIAQVTAPVGGSLLSGWVGYPPTFGVGAVCSAAAAVSLLMADRATHRQREPSGRRGDAVPGPRRA